MLVEGSDTLQWLIEHGGVASNYTGLFVIVYLLMDKVQNWNGSPEFRVLAKQLEKLNGLLENFIQRLE